MKPLLQRTLRPASRREARRAARGSILIIVLWICLGLVALTLYFANSMSTELRAADNRVCDAAAREAVAAGTRYAAYILTQYATGGRVPLPEEYRAEALPVGEATFWFVGRDNDSPVSRDPYFGLIDESSKFNINSVRRADLVKLASLPGFSNLTEDLADSIIAWRNANSQTAASGNAEVVKAKRRVAATLKLNDTVEDMLISLTKQYHILRPLERNDKLFLYVVLDRAKSNLAMARHELRSFEKNLEFA